MNLPPWVQETIRKFEAPTTGKVVLELECYQGGVTKIEIGGVVRVKPEACMTCAAGEACSVHPEKSTVIHQIIRRR